MVILSLNRRTQMAELADGQRVLVEDPIDHRGQPNSKPFYWARARAWTPDGWLILDFLKMVAIPEPDGVIAIRGPTRH